MKMKNSCTFCMHPFTGLATREDGAIKVCCRSLPIANIKDMSLEEAWNSDAMKEVRRQVLNDERPDVCQPCFDLEDQGVQSLRQRHITDSSPESRSNLYPNALDSLQSDYSMPFELPTMEIKINNLCNLKCRMCNPLDSTQWKDWSSIVSHYEKEGNYLVDAVKNLGLDDSLIELPGLTPGMLMTLGEQKILTLNDFADLASDELTGTYDVVNGEKVKIKGYLEEFALTRQEADNLIMTARNIIYKD